MSSRYSFCPQSPSYLAMKYMRTYTPYSTALLPGERYRLHLDMESNVPGYKDINREMRDLSVEIDSRRRAMTSPDRELVPYIALNNSSVGYTTTSTHGNCWRTEYHPNTIRFSAAGNPLIRERGLDNVYRYYSTYRSKIF